MGTADYVAPEQIQGHAIDGRADIYSLGCVLYEMLTGEVAYPKDGDIAKLWAHISNPPPQPSTTRTDLVPAFDEVVARATAKDPADRYATAGEMAAAAREAIALQQAQTGSAIPPMSLGGAAAPSPTPPPSPVPAAPVPAAPESWAGSTPSTPASAPPSGASTPPVSPPTHASAQPAEPPPAAPPPPAPPPAAQPSRSAPGGRSIAVIALVALGALAVVGVLLVSSGGKDKNPSAASAANNTTPAEPAGDKLSGALGPVPTNHVTGAGDIAMRLDGTTLTVTVAAHGLVDGKHAMHIHAGARGVCPPASAARRHNGHLAISTVDGGPLRAARHGADDEG